MNIQGKSLILATLMAVLDTALSKSLQASSFKAGTLFRLKGKWTDMLDESKLMVL